jgi:hypothetical protein
MMVNPASLEAKLAEVRVHASRQQGSKSSVRSKKQARKGHAARKLKRALNAKNLGGNLALEAKPLGGAGVEFTAALILGLMVVTATLQKFVKHSKVVMTTIKHSIRQLKRPKKCFVPTPEESVVAASGLAELLACLEMTSLYSASSERGQNVVQHPGPSELIVKLARPAVDRPGNAGPDDKTLWSLLFESSTIRATGAGEAAVASSGTVQGILGQRAGAPVDEQALDIWARGLDQALASGRSEADPGLAQDAPSGPALPPGNEKIASSVAELKPSPAQNAPSWLAPLPGDGQTAGCEAESEPSPARDAPSGPMLPPGGG